MAMDWPKIGYRALPYYTFPYETSFQTRSTVTKIIFTRIGTYQIFVDVVKQFPIKDKTCKVFYLTYEVHQLQKRK